MNLKKILRFVLILIGAIIGLLLIFIAVTVGPLDRTPAQQLPSYDLTMARLDSLKGFVIPKAKTGFFVGYSKVNITPTSPLATAGYGNRKGKPFTHVHDSIYVRTLVFDNGTSRVAIVSADLLIVPPSVYELLQRKLPTIGFSLDNTYLGAIHTHNSIGHWGNGAAQFIYGGYRDSVVQAIADHIVQSITLASNNMLHATVRTGAVPIPEAVGNRLTDEGRVDSLLRVIEVQRSDGSKLLWTSYTAHATCLFSRDLFLSRDYPGKVVDKLEMQGYDFVMFMAGAVGSHGCKPPAFGESCIDWMADTITKKFITSRESLHPANDSTLFMLRMPLPLSDPQLKIEKDWKVRPWFFRTAMGEYPVYLTALRIGDVVLAGTPCDFSGEFSYQLNAVASWRPGSQLMVTSFNGGYIGYVTPLERYDRNHYETRLMNWYAPGTGEYIEECLYKLIPVMLQHSK